MKLLLEYKADVNFKTNANTNGMTALGLAAAKGHYDVVKYLIEDGGAKPELKSKFHFILFLKQFILRVLNYLIILRFSQSFSLSLVF